MSEDEKFLISVLICYNIFLLISICFNYLYYKYNIQKDYYYNYFKFINDAENVSFGLLIFITIDFIFLISYIIYHLFEKIYNIL